MKQVFSLLILLLLASCAKQQTYVIANPACSWFPVSYGKTFDYSYIDSTYTAAGFQNRTIRCEVNYMILNSYQFTVADCNRLTVGLYNTNSVTATASFTPTALIKANLISDTLLFDTVVNNYTYQIIQKGQLYTMTVSNKTYTNVRRAYLLILGPSVNLSVFHQVEYDFVDDVGIIYFDDFAYGLFTYRDDVYFLKS